MSILKWIGTLIGLYVGGIMIFGLCLWIYDRYVKKINDHKFGRPDLFQLVVFYWLAPMVMPSILVDYVKDMRCGRS